VLQQFHDILPGSSIAWVHREAERRYADVAADLERLIVASISRLAGAGNEEIAFNAGPFEPAGVPGSGAGSAVWDPEAEPVRGGGERDRVGGGHRPGAAAHRPPRALHLPGRPGHRSRDGAAG
jgi:alpha-mannosidase